MAISVKCPGCQTRLSVADQYAGKAVRCPRCGGRVPVARAVPPDARIALNPAPGAVSQETPKEIGGFAVRRVLGAGAFGTVYLGHDRALDRAVALKVPHPHTFTTAKTRKRFETEARSVARLRHPHIVPIYAAGFDGAYYFIASQFIAGPARKGGDPVQAMTLEEAIEEKEGGLAFQKAARIVHDLAEALAYAHESGIVHRDVKPANVLLDEQGRAHLADFGLAHQEDAADKLTQDGAIMGTPAYMAPEQGRGRDEDVLPACDQYSLGIVLYELLTGKVPFSGPVGLVISLHQNEEVKPPHKVRPGVPLDLETICLKALEKDPDKRYGSCGEMAADLGRWLEGEPIRARRMGLWERSARWVRRNPVVAGLTAAVAASLVLGAVVATALAARATAFAARATQQEKLATAAATRSEDAAEQTRKEKERADKKAEEAKRNEATANEQKDKAEWEVYVGQIALAQHEWEDGEALLARQHLDASKKTLRDWEYRYLDTLFGRGQRTIKTGVYRPMTLAPDGRRFAGTDLRDGSLKIWDTERGQALLALKCSAADFQCLCYSHDGRRLAGGGKDATIKVWDAEQGTELLTLKGPTLNGGFAAGVFQLCFSTDGKRLASAGDSGTVKIWDADRGQELSTFKKTYITCLTFSADGKQLAGGGEGTVTVWDAEQGKEAFTLQKTQSEVSSVNFSPDGGRLASGENDGTVKVWDAKRGQELLTLRGHTRGVTCMDFSPDGRRLARAGGDGTVKIWGAVQGQQLLILRMARTETFPCQLFGL